MKALVTGATGFVGSAVMRRLLRRGWQVRVLARATSDRRNLEGFEVELCEGDLTDAAALSQAVAGVNAVFHVAADYRLWVPDPAAMYATNVEGTRKLMQAALAAGVSRIVYTSSVATLGLDPSGEPADEETPVTLDDMIGHYKRSKFLAEQVVREMVEKEGLPAVIVNPSTPLGPNDIRPTPTGQLIVDAATGRMPAYVDTGLNFVHVEDVAEGHLLAFEKGRLGTRYILGGENLSLRALLERLSAITGRPAPRIKLAHWAILPVAYGMEGWARLAGTTPRVTVDGVKLARKHMYFSSARAHAELGYAPRPVEQALEDAVAWFRAHGYCS